MRTSLRYLVFSTLVACGFLTGNSLAKSPWGAYARKPDAWYGTQEATLIARNILSYQSVDGIQKRRRGESVAAV